MRRFCCLVNLMKLCLEIVHCFVMPIFVYHWFSHWLLVHIIYCLYHILMQFFGLCWVSTYHVYSWFVTIPSDKSMSYHILSLSQVLLVSNMFHVRPIWDDDPNWLLTECHVSWPIKRGDSQHLGDGPFIISRCHMGLSKDRLASIRFSAFSYLKPSINWGVGHGRPVLMDTAMWHAHVVQRVEST